MMLRDNKWQAWSRWFWMSCGWLSMWAASADRPRKAPPWSRCNALLPWLLSEKDWSLPLDLECIYPLSIWAESVVQKTLDDDAECWREDAVVFHSVLNLGAVGCTSIKLRKSIHVETSADEAKIKRKADLSQDLVKARSVDRARRLSQINKGGMRVPRTTLHFSSTWRTNIISNVDLLPLRPQCAPGYIPSTGLNRYDKNIWNNVKAHRHYCNRIL